MFAIVFDSVGFGEWVVLLAVILVVAGPKRLPSIARSMGAHYSRLRRAAENFKRQIMDMDTEFSKATDSVAKEAEDMFKSEGDEASAIPSGDGTYDDGTLDVSDDGSDAYDFEDDVPSPEPEEEEEEPSPEAEGSPAVQQPADPPPAARAEEGKSLEA